MDFFSIHHTLITILGYHLSYVEFIGVITGIGGLFFASREKTINWPLNLVSIICFFSMFYQTTLYAQMFFQAYFFVIAIIGWITWKKEDQTHNSSMRFLTNKQRYATIGIIIVATLFLDWLMIQLPHWAPTIFPQADAHPLLDSFISVGSIVAFTLLMKKKIENWLVWIVLDVLSAFLYYEQGIKFAALQYVIFSAIVLYGFISWTRKLKTHQH